MDGRLVDGEGIHTLHDIDLAPVRPIRACSHASRLSAHREMGNEDQRTIRPEGWPSATTSRCVHGVQDDKALCKRVVRGYTHALAVAGYSLRSVDAHVGVAHTVDTR